MNGRHEQKYYINSSDYAQLRAMLRTVAKPDVHALSDGTYRVRSLYFDNYSDKVITDKLSGQSRREKFRVRYYNGDTSFIRLERKSKANKLSYKEDTMITAAQCMALIAGDYSCLNMPGDPLMMELYAKVRCQNLRPKSIVDYDREAYTYRAGNVRITFDANVRTSNNIAGFLDPEQVTIPAANTIIMEVKYDGFLPDMIRGLLSSGCSNQTEFSKYVAARLV